MNDCWIIFVFLRLWTNHIANKLHFQCFAPANWIDLNLCSNWCRLYYALNLKMKMHHNQCSLIWYVLSEWVLSQFHGVYTHICLKVIIQLSISICIAAHESLLNDMLNQTCPIEIMNRQLSANICFNGLGLDETTYYPIKCVTIKSPV